MQRPRPGEEIVGSSVYPDTVAVVALERRNPYRCQAGEQERVAAREEGAGKIAAAGRAEESRDSAAGRHDVAAVARRDGTDKEEVAPVGTPVDRVQRRGAMYDGPCPTTADVVDLEEVFAAARRAALHDVRELCAVARDSGHRRVTRRGDLRALADDERRPLRPCQRADAQPQHHGNAKRA